MRSKSVAKVNIFINSRKVSLKNVEKKIASLVRQGIFYYFCMWQNKGTD
ncbi:hypothetical protein HMPREF0658_0403 [Hoylesella marshii DSM 16973 = JCM 13450]|uniref:Uncharacterized protein n=1 Tax=Hoylesella marshii DSM 16973 = JCM 13450 TaxID=862515 RepID=E0NQF2_9BACT|nr:hypothetical protein HMPREF0658_0403 [Hoylesella marshii DSM 16973 = JCM 13450]